MTNLYLFLYPLVFFLVVDFLGFVFYRKVLSSSKETLKARVTSKNTFMENYRGGLGMSMSYHSYDNYPMERYCLMVDVNGKNVCVDVSKWRYDDVAENSQIEVTKNVETVEKKRIYLATLFKRQSLFYTSQEETYSL